MSALPSRPAFAGAAPVAGIEAEPFTARALTAADAGAFRAIRLEALQTEPRFLGVPYEDEAGHAMRQWQERCTETPGHCFFGLFHGPQLVGTVAAVRWDEDASGKTALWKSAYVAPEFRGQGLAAPLYRAREDWTRARFERAVFFIRDGNRRSTDIHLKNGARFMFTRPMSWGGRPPAPWHWFEKPLRPARELSIVGAAPGG